MQQGCGEEGTLTKALLAQHHPVLKIFQVSPSQTCHVPGAASHAASRVLDQAASPCFPAASQSSAGIAQVLTGPKGLGGQCSAEGHLPWSSVQHHHSCRSSSFPLPSHPHLCKLRLQRGANSPQHCNFIRRDLHDQSVKPRLKGLFHRCLWQGSPPLAAAGIGR